MGNKPGSVGEASPKAALTLERKASPPVLATDGQRTTAGSG